MLRRAWILRTFAFLAVAAFANAQSMICCVFPVRIAGLPAQEMASDHSCCQKTASIPGEQTCSPEISTHGCNGPAESEALQSVSFENPENSPATVQHSIPMLEPKASPGPQFASETPLDTGPPRFLALRRLLI
jgi:hypothetical protein